MNDIAIPMYLNGRKSFGATASYEDLWRQRVLSVLCTPPRTRAMRPYFGTSSQEPLFDTVDNATSKISGAIGRAFNNHLSALSLQSVEVSNSGDGALVVDIWYRLPNGAVSTTTMSANPSNYGVGA